MIQILEISNRAFKITRLNFQENKGKGGETDEEMGDLEKTIKICKK